MTILSDTDAEQKPGDVTNAEQRKPVSIRKQDRARLFEQLAEASDAKAAARGMTDKTLKQVMKDVSCKALRRSRLKRNSKPPARLAARV